MKKIPTLFKRDDVTRFVCNEVMPGCEWVLNGEGIPTEKYDGMACMVRNERLFKRYDRKLKKTAARRKKKYGFARLWRIEDFKPAPDGWEPAEVEPDFHSGHWSGWVPVSKEKPEDAILVRTFDELKAFFGGFFFEGTCEFVGPKVQGNPYNLDQHELWPHGYDVLKDVPRDFHGLWEYLAENKIEGIVWHHPDGRMVKLKRKDFGFLWP